MPDRPTFPTRLPDRPFSGLPVCRDLARVEAAALILGAPIATLYPSVGAFAAGSPAAIRAAMTSERLGHHDFEIDGSLLEDAFGPVVDAGDLVTDEADFAGNRAAIAAAVRRILDVGAVPIVLGGDDSVPIPVLQAYEDRGPLTVLQIDAHIDWRDVVNGERHGLSSNMRRASEMGWVDNIIQVGMRHVGSARRGEYEEALDWGARIITARQVFREGIECALDLIPAAGDVYIAFDCDSLDCSIMPAVLAPTPGGLSYWDVVEMVHGAADRGNLVGFSLVEFAPDRDPDGHAAHVAGRITLNAAAAAARQRC